jgi:hypothetical protein
MAKSNHSFNAQQPVVKVSHGLLVSPSSDEDIVRALMRFDH